MEKVMMSLSFYRKVNEMRAPQIPKANLLIEAAMNSIGLMDRN
jgi:hypothetical protein